MFFLFVDLLVKRLVMYTLRCCDVFYSAYKNKFYLQTSISICSNLTRVESSLCNAVLCAIVVIRCSLYFHSMI